MAEPNESGGSSGGGSTTNICTINPSDNVSVLNNLLSRISDIEKFLSQLVGADVHADNLSELAANIGNILNGTITLPSDGNSPYGAGGSIPIPDGFSGQVISGNTTTIWENGVVSFQVTPSSGVVTGGINTALFQTSGGAVGSGPTGTDLTWTTIEEKDFAINNISSISLLPGLYLITANGLVLWGGGVETVADVRIGSPLVGNSQMFFGFHWNSGAISTADKAISGAIVTRFPDALDGSIITGFMERSGSSIIAGPFSVSISRLGT